MACRVVFIIASRGGIYSEGRSPASTRACALGVTALFFIVDQNADDLRKLTDLVSAGTIRAIIGHRF